MKNELIKIFEKYCGKVDFFADGVEFSDKLDSLSLIKMITDIEEQFGFNFEMDDLKQETVNSPKKLLKMIESKKNSQ